MELIEPEARILPKDVRLKRSALDAILQRWKQSQIRPGPISSLKNGKGELVPGDTHHRWPAWVFDNDSSAGEKTSAEVPDPGPEPDGDPGAIAAASDDRKPTKEKKKKVRYSPSAVLQMQDDLVKSNGGSTRGVRQLLLQKLSVSDTALKNLLRVAKTERQEVEATRKAAGPFGQLVSGGKRS